MENTSSSMGDHKPKKSAMSLLLSWIAIIQLPLILLGYGIAYGIQGELGLGITPVSLIDAYQLLWIVIARIVDNSEQLIAGWMSSAKGYFWNIFWWGWLPLSIIFYLIMRASKQSDSTDKKQVCIIFSSVKEYLHLNQKRDQSEKWTAQIVRAIVRATFVAVTAFLGLAVSTSLMLLAILALAILPTLGLMAGISYVSQIKNLPSCNAEIKDQKLTLDQSMNAKCEKIRRSGKLIAEGRHVLTLGDTEFIFDAKNKAGKKIIFKDADYSITQY